MVGVIKAGLLYFGLVAAAGFILGPIRVLWAVPRFGERTAELLEAPLMLAVIVLAARIPAGRLEAPVARLAAGLLALTLMVLVELVVVLRLRGLTLTEYVALRDPVAGLVYVALLLIFALAPLFRATGRRGG